MRTERGEWLIKTSKQTQSLQAGSFVSGTACSWIQCSRQGGWHRRVEMLFILGTQSAFLSDLGVYRLHYSISNHLENTIQLFYTHTDISSNLRNAYGRFAGVTGV